MSYRAIRVPLTLCSVILRRRRRGVDPWRQCTPHPRAATRDGASNGGVERRWSDSGCGGGASLQERLHARDWQGARCPHPLLYSGSCVCVCYDGVTHATTAECSAATLARCARRVLGALYAYVSRPATMRYRVFYLSRPVTYPTSDTTLYTTLSWWPGWE